MDLLIIVFWFVSFTVIVLFLGGLTYFIWRQNSTSKIFDNSQIDSMNQAEQQLRRGSAGSRRKNSRQANKKRQQAAAAAATSNSKEKQVKKSETPPPANVEKDEQEESISESSPQLSDDEEGGGGEEEQQQQKEQFEDTIDKEEVFATPSLLPMKNEQQEHEQPISTVKQRNKNKNSNGSNSKPPILQVQPAVPSAIPEVSSFKEDAIQPVKPQASVAPVKQTYSPVPKTHSSAMSQSNRSSANLEHSHYIQQDNYKSNTRTSATNSYHIYPYSGHSSLPPRLQQQRQKKEAAAAAQAAAYKQSPSASPRSSIPPGSAARHNEFVPSSLRQQHMGNHRSGPPPRLAQNHREQQQSSNSYPQQQQQHQQQQQQYRQQEQESSTHSYPQQQPQQQYRQQEQECSPNNNGYSSESDVYSDSSSPAQTNVSTPLLSPPSASSSLSLKSLDLIRSSSSSTTHTVLDDLLSIFDSVTFSPDELELILYKVANKQILSKQDWQRILTAKGEKNHVTQTIERILDESYRNQCKILAVELQAEKSRVLDLSKANTDMDILIRQLQQQQQPNNANLVQQQQMLLSYQMQMRRLSEENARLIHQLHVLSVMPSSINEFKQQLHIANEQLRQLNIKNSALEKEIADGERASKHAAEAYKKADAQKQERIEQLLVDSHKCKRLDKELVALRLKYTDSEVTLTSQLNDVTRQRDELHDKVEHFQNQCNEHEQIQLNSSSDNELQHQCEELKAKNDLLRQRNWKVMEELNKLLQEKQQQDQSQIL